MLSKITAFLIGLFALFGSNVHHIPVDEPLVGGTVLLGTQGGTGISTYNKGDLIYASTSFGPAVPGFAHLARLSSGSANQLLNMTAGMPSWTSNIKVNSASVSGNFETNTASVSSNFKVGGISNLLGQMFGTTASLSSNLEIAGTASVSKVVIAGTSDTPELTVRANSTQTANTTAKILQNNGNKLVTFGGYSGHPELGSMQIYGLDDGAGSTEYLELSHLTSFEGIVFDSKATGTGTPRDFFFDHAMVRATAGFTTNFIPLLANSGNPPYMSFTENGVDFRGSIGFAAGNGDMRFYNDAGNSGFASGTLRLSLKSGGVVQMPFYGTGLAAFDASGNISSTLSPSVTRIDAVNASVSGNFEVTGTSVLGGDGGLYATSVGTGNGTLGFNSGANYGGVSYAAGVTGAGFLMQYTNSDSTTRFYNESSVAAGTGHAHTQILQINPGSQGASMSVPFENTKYVSASQFFGDIQNTTLGFLTGATYKTTQQNMSIVESAGWVSGGTMASTSSTTISVSSGSGLIRTTDSSTGNIVDFDWPASSSVTVPLGQITYIGVTYNAGSPKIEARTDDQWNYHTEFPLGRVVNQAGTLYVVPDNAAAADATARMILLTYQTMPFARDSRSGGLILAESADNQRHFSSTAGAFWDRLNRYAMSLHDTATGELVDVYFGSTASATPTTVWPNTKYNNGGVLTDMTNNKYANDWIYECSLNRLILVYGTNQYNTFSQADAEGVPTILPQRVTANCLLIGRIQFQKGATIATEVDSAFTQSFTSGAVTNHANLSNLGWLTSGHTGTANTLASFDSSGVASESAEGKYIYRNGTRSFTGVETFSAGASVSLGLEVLDGGYASLSNTFWVSPPGKAGNIGIGTSAPISNFQIGSSVLNSAPTSIKALINSSIATDNKAGQSDTLVLSNGGTDPTSNIIGPALEFKSATFGTTNTFSTGRIMSYFDTSRGSNPGFSGAILALQYPTADNTFTTGMVLRNGNIGIGDTTPNAKLNVAGNIIASASGNVDLILNSTGNQDGKWTLRSTSTNGLEVLGSVSQIFMTIASSGNVGIGTASPVSLLDISALPGAAASGSAFTLSRFDGIVSSNDVIGQISFWNNDVSITNGNNLYGRIDVRAAQNIVGNAAGYMRFLTASTSLNEVMRLTSSGNVGIGTTNIDAQFELNGNARTLSSVASISGTSLNGGSIFNVAVPASSSSNNPHGLMLVTDTSGSIIASWSMGGTLALRGRILSRGANSTCTGVNVGGSGCLDYAESFASEHNIPAGTVVALDYETGGVHIAVKGDEAIGVISTNAAVLITGNEVRTGIAAVAPPGYVPVALAGRVPVKVCGTVHAGDHLALNDNGCASTMTDAGMSLGIALNGGDSTVTMLVQNTWWDVPRHGWLYRLLANIL